MSAKLPAGWRSLRELPDVAKVLLLVEEDGKRFVIQGEVTKASNGKPWAEPITLGMHGCGCCSSYDHNVLAWQTLPVTE